MRARRLVAITAGSVLGVVAGLILSAAAVVGVVLLALWLTEDSPSTHARKEVQSAFDGGGARNVTVKGCTQIGSDEDSLIYRCTILAPGCVRQHRFAVSRNGVYDVAFYSVSADVTVRPCRYPSD